MFRFPISAALGVLLSASAALAMLAFHKGAFQPQQQHFLLEEIRTAASTRAGDPLNLKRLPSPPDIFLVGYPASDAAGAYALLDCGLVHPEIPYDAVAGFFDACTEAAGMITSPVHQQDLQDLAGSPIHVTANLDLLRRIGQEVICDIGKGIPLPYRGQTIAEFMSNKALCHAYLAGASAVPR